MLRTSVDTSSMFGLLRSKNMTLSAECNRPSHHNHLDNVTGRFPFAIQHLLGIDTASRHHHPHDVNPFTQHQQHQQQSPMSTDISTMSRPTSDDVTYNAWKCPPSVRHVTSSDVTPTTWYRGTDAMMLDDVIGSVNARRQSSLPTLESHRRFTAASLSNLPSPTNLLPTLSANVSGKPFHHSVPTEY